MWMDPHNPLPSCQSATNTAAKRREMNTAAKRREMFTAVSHLRSAPTENTCNTDYRLLLVAN